MISRRGFVGALSALSCAGEGDMADRPSPPVGRPPWHMWGRTIIVDVPNNRPNGGNSGESQQIAKVSYGRPESWGFMFGARLIGQPQADTLSETFVSVQFDVALGIGRTMFSTLQSVNILDAFCLLQFRVPISTAMQDRPALYTSTVLKTISEWTPVRDVEVSHIVAEDIQCSVRAFYSAPTNIAPPPFKVEATAMFAPLVHMRPEWSLRQFRGGEQYGE